MTEASARVKSFKTLSGLGDAVFAVPIVQHFAKSGPVYVSTHYPDVFRDTFSENIAITNQPQSAAVRLGYHPATGRNYYASMCLAAAISTPLPFSMVWTSPVAIDFGKPFTDGRYICLIKEPSAPHMFRDRNDFTLAPAWEAVQNWVIQNRRLFYFVTVEHDTNTIPRRLVGIDKRFSGLSVSEYISLISLVDHVAAQISHLCPLAQILGKPLTLFKPEDAKPRAGFLKHVTPDMILVPKEFAPAEVEIV